MNPCGVHYGTGEPAPNGTAVCGRPFGHPSVARDGVGHHPTPVAADLPPEDAAQLGRSLAVATRSAKPWPRDGVELISAGRWMVPSAEKAPGAYWLVEAHHRPDTGNFMTCTCPAGQTRGEMGTASRALARFCRHCIAALTAEQDDGYPKRPTPPANVSALCD